MLEKESIYLNSASTEIIKSKNNGCYHRIIAAGGDEPEDEDKGDESQIGTSLI